jgi:arylsulfatase A-like enzyme
MAMCTGVDRAFGRLLDKLDERGLADDTLVVFTSDHGDMLNALGQNFPKCTPHDYSARVPLLVRTPERLRAGQASELLVGALDLPPTLLGLLGVSVPGEFQGRDLSGAIARGDDDAVESVPLFFFAPEWHGVVTREHTFASGVVPHWQFSEEKGRHRGSQRCDVLFDRLRDPHQLTDLHGTPQGRAVRPALKALTDEWMARFGYTWGASPIVGQAYHQIRQGPGGLDSARTPAAHGRPIDMIQRA